MNIKVKRPGPPFGVGVARFLDIGYHPGFEVRPGTFKHPDIFPGCYDWNRPKRIVSKISRWQRNLELEEYSRRLGYHGDDILKQRQWMKSVNGPGWQELPYYSPERNVTFSKGERFPISKIKSFFVAGPGTYGKNHVPYTRMEEKSRSKGFSYSILPSFERSSCLGRSLSLQRSYHLPPNLYHLKNSIDELILKKVSKKGPYQLFSGSRFPDLPSSNTPLIFSRMHTSDLKHPKNEFKGKFQRCGKESRITSRMIVKDVSYAHKDPLDPGPTHYHPYQDPAVIPTKFPFNSSVEPARPSVKCRLQPPPGRYNTEMKNRIKGDGLRSAFLSKTKRNMPKVQKFSWFE